MLVETSRRNACLLLARHSRCQRSRSTVVCCRYGASSLESATNPFRAPDTTWAPSPLQHTLLEEPAVNSLRSECPACPSPDVNQHTGLHWSASTCRSGLLNTGLHCLPILLGAQDTTDRKQRRRDGWLRNGLNHGRLRSGRVKRPNLSKCSGNTSAPHNDASCSQSLMSEAEKRSEESLS